MKTYIQQKLCPDDTNVTIPSGSYKDYDFRLSSSTPVFLEVTGDINNGSAIFQFLKFVNSEWVVLDTNFITVTTASFNTTVSMSYLDSTGGQYKLRITAQTSVDYGEDIHDFFCQPILKAFILNHNPKNNYNQVLFGSCANSVTKTMDIVSNGKPLYVSLIGNFDGSDVLHWVSTKIGYKLSTDSNYTIVSGSVGLSIEASANAPYSNSFIIDGLEKNKIYNIEGVITVGCGSGSHSENGGCPVLTAFEI